MRGVIGRTETVSLVAACGAVAGLLFAVSHWVPWVSPDTAGYQDPPPLPQAWAGPRHPLFGWLLAVFPERDYSALPILQILAFFASTIFLYRSLRIFGVSVRGGRSVAAACLGSNLLLLWHNAVHPEVPSVVAVLLAFGATIRLAAGRPFLPWTVALAVSLGLAYLLRPAFLPAIALLPLLYGLLSRLGAGQDRLLLRIAVLTLACAAPFLANSTIRWRAVGDFNIVSFGGFQMSGMAGLMLTPQIVDELPSQFRPLGEAILAGRAAAEAKGEVIATPMNSRGERSVVSAAAGYYDIYARTYDSLLYGTIAPLQRDRSWVDWNAQLMRFSLTVVRTAPLSYGAWLVGGSSRLVGRALVIDLPMIAALASLAMLYPLLLWRRGSGFVVGAGPKDVPVLICLTTVYTIAAAALSIATTFPAARYIDTSELLLPALPIYATMSVVAALRRDRD